MDSVCEECSLLNKECSFAVLLNSLQHGKMSLKVL